MTKKPKSMKAPRKKAVSKGLAALRATRVMPRQDDPAADMARRFVLTVAGAARLSGNTFKQVADAADALNLEARENVQIQDTAAQVGEYCLWQLVEGRDGTRLFATTGILRKSPNGAPMVNRAAE